MHNSFMQLPMFLEHHPKCLPRNLIYDVLYIALFFDLVIAKQVASEFLLS